MIENFPKALQFVLKWEGGHSWDGNDPGGETKYGISKRSHPDLDIEGLTKEEAETIYREEYWNRINGDGLPWPDDLALFDTAVNLGVHRSLIMYQDSRDWKDLLLKRINYYYTLLSRRPSLQKYLRGWLNRVYDLQDICNA